MALACSAKVVSATKAEQPWPPPQRFVGRNPPTRRPKPMGDVPKRILLAYSAEAAASAAKAGRQGYGAYPHSSPLRGGG